MCNLLRSMFFGTVLVDGYALRGRGKGGKGMGDNGKVEEDGRRNEFMAFRCSFVQC